ncbi:hypothetical protein ACUUYQ_19430 [Bacillus halotolerans]|uniref:hypothetical protein n=1 Tax=Bacillus subtilis group TaxID=653685 RepID=UPI00100A206B|nr:hypothetical protein [Bacillus subtilis]QAW34690.1 hypothetical protein ETK61_18645 [Bacillus subtilis]
MSIQLKISDMIITPYAHRLDDDEWGIAVTFATELSFDEYEEILKIRTLLWESKGYYPITLLTDSKNYDLNIRFGRTFYSKHDGYIKLLTTLVDESVDKVDEQRNYIDLQHRDQVRMMEMLFEQENTINSLLSILNEKKLLTNDEVSQLKNNKSRFEQFVEFYEEKNVDENVSDLIPD